jgi:hypothetical protein
MNRKHYFVLLVVAGAAYLLGTLGPSGAVAQRTARNEEAAPAAAAAAAGGRYQISAFAGQAKNGDVFHGCYIADTTTGQVWMSIPGQGAQAQRVSPAPR